MPEELPSDHDTQPTAATPGAGQGTGPAGAGGMSGSSGPVAGPSDDLTEGGDSPAAPPQPTQQPPATEVPDAGADAATPAVDTVTDATP